ncbi:glutamine--fructose-6-phosphate transaminase (isomerizing) [Amedibacillus sp. YH-ame10]
MCGIIGYAGLCKISNSVLIEGLQSLEYRGYDSAGVALVHNEQVEIIKEKGNVRFLKEKLAKSNIPSGMLGIAHTRWATHGEPSEINSHPHQSGSVTLVHNGIIENYHELRTILEEAGYTFQSQTDSEIAAAYIDYCYQSTKDKQKALAKAYHAFRGSFAFAIIFHDEVDAIYAMRKNSPLILGVDADKAFLGSDISAFLKYTNRYILLEHEEIAKCSSAGIIIKSLEGDFIQKEILESDLDIKDIQKDGFEHFMLKEIHEESEVVKKTIHSLMQEDISELLDSMPDMSNYESLHIVACGSAMYAGMIAKSLIETKARIQVDCVCASEYRYANPIFKEHTLVIVISQSGETADTIAALQLAKQNQVDTLAIVNVVGSTIARLADHVIYTMAGPEICVATTKAYCTQVAVLSLIACNLAYTQGFIKDEEAKRISKEIQELPAIMDDLIHNEQYAILAKKIADHNNVFFIGRGLDYSLSMEGSLKLKEISYIHSEAYPAGELKHGTISLIEEGTPVIALATDEDLYEKTISNIKEVKARGAYVLLLISDDLHVANDYYDAMITVPKVDKLLQGILTVIPLQLLAYHIANLRGCEIDQPRNLAKSVTVE